MHLNLYNQSEILIPYTFEEKFVSEIYRFREKIIRLKKKSLVLTFGVHIYIYNVKIFLRYFSKISIIKSNFLV